MRIAILGTRGIPNNYGGFEQISEYLSAGLVNRGYDVTVYCSHKHPYKKSILGNVKLVHCYDPEHLLGTAGQFIYDWNCIKHARKNRYDALLFMGYTSSSVWGRFFPSKTLVISNMDGMEWRRSKYAKPVRKFLKYAEKLAVRYSHYHIADSKAIQSYLDQQYDIKSHYIPYGASAHVATDENLLEQYGLEKKEYFMAMARLEPENNVELILDGYLKSGSLKKMIVVGNTSTALGKRLQAKYDGTPGIKFLGPVFKQDILHTLRTFSSIYFHGHSVGGTNPSLLEAMASHSLIAAHHNPFNRSILEEDAFYFLNSDEVADIISKSEHFDTQSKKENNRSKINTLYNWETITDQYDQFIQTCYTQFHS